MACRTAAAVSHCLSAAAVFKQAAAQHRIFGLTYRTCRRHLTNPGLESNGWEGWLHNEKCRMADTALLQQLTANLTSCWLLLDVQPTTP
jgi:hypothetical protein